MLYTRSLGDRYTPLFLFNALAAGALALTFFFHLSLLFWTRDNVALMIFPALQKFFDFSKPNYLALIWLFVMGAGFLWFLVDHVRLMLWNHKQERATPHPLRAIKPLSFMMTLLLAFVTFVFLIPGLWGIREYLFPLVFLGLALGVFFAFKTMTATQPFATLESIALLSFCAIGFSMIVIFTQKIAYVYAGHFLSLFCLAGIFFVAAKACFSGLITALKDIKSAVEKATLLWFCVPVLALLAVVLQRQDLALVVGLQGARAPLWTINALAVMLSFILFLTALALAASRESGFLALIFKNDSFSVGSYTLVLGLVGIFVVGHFLIMNGLVTAGIMERYSLGFWLAYTPLVLIQAGAIWGHLKLNAKLFGARKA
ncbi:MAG: hypothetical protein FWF24_07065 [Alphaproteobacteria bacterium]|nr:hypothetical protein [Alphaproteobacteria bacterium]